MSETPKRERLNMGELKRILDGKGADGWPLDGIPGWVLSYLAPLNAKARGERLTELHAALLDAAPASAPPASAYASPIREPEISRTDLIKLLADHFGFRPYEQMAEDKSDLRGKVRDGYDVNEPTKSDLAEAADAILNLAPVGGRGEEGSSRADLSPASRSSAQHSAEWRCRRCGRDEIDCRADGCPRGPCPMEFVG